MFLELSFDSRAGDKGVSASKASSSWRYDRQDKPEMSLDELISDFQQSATSRQSKSSSGSDASPLQLRSPPRHSKTKESDKKSWRFADQTRAVKQRDLSKKKPTAAMRNVSDDDSSDEDGGVVMPMPRLEQVLRNKPSFALKRRPTLPSASARPKQSLLRPTPKVRSSVLLSPSGTSRSLSPVTSASVASSPLSMSEDLPTPDKPEEDSIDALIGKDIRDLNKLISSKGRQTRDKKTIGAASSPSTDEILSVLRQSSRFRKVTSKDPRLCLKMPNGKTRLVMPESPPPPPPPVEEDTGNSEDDEEDSFAGEIRKLRESRRLRSLPVQPPQNETPSEEIKLESTEVCTTAALKVRNASNAINELLLQALKPFEDRQREEEKAKALEEDNTSGDAVLRNAATAELQSATQTIVSQLDLTFADMTERRKADLKAEEDAVATAKEAEKKEVEAAQAKKKADEKETKEREMEILRLIPMQGKLLTCSADIENVLTQLDSTEVEAQSQPLGSAFAMEAEIKALRSHTQRKIQEIEAQMTATSQQGKSDQSDGLSWRAVDWMQDNLDVKQADRTDRSKNELSEKTDSVETQADAAADEGAYQDILQRQVVEKLDLTMLKLKHVLSIETKDAAEVQEKQQREKEEQKKKQTQQQLEDERKRREAEDAENARRRVMGLTSVDEVEGWVEEGRQLQEEMNHDRLLNHLIASLNDNMNVEIAGDFQADWGALPSSPNQKEAIYDFDRLETTMAARQPAPRISEEAIEQHSSWQAPRAATRDRPTKTHAWDELSGSSSGSDEEISSSDSWPDDGIRIAPRRQNQLSTGQRNWSHPFPSPSLLPSPSQQIGHASQRRKQRQYDNDEVGRKNNLKVRYDGSYSPGLKQRRRRRGVGELKPDVARMIHALQAERRQKTWWIQSHARSPVGRHRAIN